MFQFLIGKVQLKKMRGLPMLKKIKFNLGRCQFLIGKVQHSDEFEEIFEKEGESVNSS